MNEPSKLTVLQKSGTDLLKATLLLHTVVEFVDVQRRLTDNRQSGHRITRLFKEG